MNKKGQWNIGLGAALIIGGIYLMVKGAIEIAILGIILIGVGVWLISK